MNLKNLNNLMNVIILSLSVVLALTVFTIYLEQPCEESTLLIATTTSTYDSGLLEYILPDFESKYNIEIRVIPVGTGQAIKNGERGDVDIILVHAPDAELKFVREGYGINRHCAMYNDFIVLGPADDPASIKGNTISTALKLIANSQSPFISRGDDSGTHKKELKLWKRGSIAPEGDWYKEVGSGMGDALRIADEMEAYILSDRGTYIALKDSLQLKVLIQGDDILLNPYGVIAVNPKLHPSINSEGASKFIAWLMSEETQDSIALFEKNGEQLFSPLRGECITWV